MHNVHIFFAAFAKPNNNSMKFMVPLKANDRQRDPN